MKLVDNLKFAGWGWVGSAVGIVVVGLVWPLILPGIVRPDHYYGSGPNLVQLMGLAILISSPAALVGGLVGGRLPREGGRTEQRLAAMILGFMASIPFAGYCLLTFSGW